jgi:hypothetical protein
MFSSGVAVAKGREGIEMRACLSLHALNLYSPASHARDVSLVFCVPERREGASVRGRIRREGGRDHLTLASRRK